jgi:hypothetical protein
MELLQRIGDRVAREWRAVGHDERAFPAIATAALQDTPPAGHVQYAEIIDALLFENRLPPQPADQSFGQPPIVVYAHPRFHVEVLCWMDATTAIHQHAFSGAFHVLAGSSVHSCYEFALRERINSRLLLGDVRFHHAELLRAGDTRTILAGPALIHGLFHLDSPSISVVVRTAGEPDTRPQYSYLPPFVALDGQDETPVDRQRMQLLAMLIATSPDAFLRVARRIVREGDLEETLRVLQFAHVRSLTPPHALEPASVASLVDSARARIGPRVDTLLATVETATRIGDIALRRAEVRDPDHRFLLALLMNVPSRRGILDLIEVRCAGEPTRVVLRWLRELTRRSSDGFVSLLDVELGGDDADDPEAIEQLLHAVVEEMLEGASGDLLLERLCKRLPDGFLDAISDDVSALEARLRSSALHSLFAGPTRP